MAKTVNISEAKTHLSQLLSKQGLIPNPEALFDPALDREIEALFYQDSSRKSNAFSK